MNVHDMLMALNKPEVGPLVRQIMKEHAEAPITINGHSMRVPADFKVSKPDASGVHRWSTLAKVKSIAPVD